jgi:hypothetical protein
MNKVFYGFNLLFLMCCSYAFSYSYKITNNTNEIVKVTLEFKEFLGACKDKNELILNPKESKNAPDRGACCMQSIRTDQGAFVFPGAGGIGIRCFNFNVSIGPNLNKQGVPQINVD